MEEQLELAAGLGGRGTGDGRGQGAGCSQLSRRSRGHPPRAVSVTASKLLGAERKQAERKGTEAEKSSRQPPVGKTSSPWAEFSGKMKANINRNGRTLPSPRKH